MTIKSIDTTNNIILETNYNPSLSSNTPFSRPEPNLPPHRGAPLQTQSHMPFALKQMAENAGLYRESQQTSNYRSFVFAKAMHDLITEMQITSDTKGLTVTFPSAEGSSLEFSKDGKKLTLNHPDVPPQNIDLEKLTKHLLGKNNAEIKPVIAEDGSIQLQLPDPIAGISGITMRTLDNGKLVISVKREGGTEDEIIQVDKDSLPPQLKAALLDPISSTASVLFVGLFTLFVALCSIVIGAFIGAGLGAITTRVILKDPEPGAILGTIVGAFGGLYLFSKAME